MGFLLALVFNMGNGLEYYYEELPNLFDCIQYNQQ